MNAPGHLAFPQALENVVYGIVRLKFNVSLHLALAGKPERLLQILSRTKD